MSIRAVPPGNTIESGAVTLFADGVAGLPPVFPAWARGATVYGAIVSRVGNGTFRDLAARLGDLADLGVGALWLAPITPTLPGHFGYEVIAYRDVRPEYGTLDDFRDLVTEAHASGIRVLLDVVPNHTSVEHPWYRSAQQDGAASPYYDWYDRDAQGNATHYFSWEHLPNLNFKHPAVREEISDALMFWVEECGVDGFRVDVAWGIRQRQPDFWPAFAHRVHAARPDGLLIAEASARDPYYLANGFHAAYDWTEALGIWAWQDIFAGERPIAAALRDVLTLTFAGHELAAGHTFRFLNNNDTGTRFITRHGLARYRVALAMLLTLPGLPCLYAGDETGAAYEPYSRPMPIPTTDPHGLRPFVRQLVHLRSTLLSLPNLTWTLLANESPDLLIYTISGGEPSSDTLVLLNFGAADLPYDHDVPRHDLLTGADIAAGVLTVPANGAFILAGGAA